MRGGILFSSLFLLLSACCDGDCADCGGCTGGQCSRVKPAGIFAVSPESACAYAFTWHSSGPAGPPVVAEGPEGSPWGKGGLRFSTGSDAEAVQEARLDAFDGTRVDGISELRYSTWTDLGGGDVAVVLRLHVDWDGDGLADDTLTFDPDRQSGGSDLLPDQPAVVPGVWQTWDARNGGWSSERSPGLAPGPAVDTLAAYVARHPDATLCKTRDGQGAVALAAGDDDGAPGGFHGACDCLLVRTDGLAFFDFEPAGSVSSDR